MTEPKHDVSGAPEEERVKPCLECGTILRFDAEICALCGVAPGQRAPAVAVAEEDEAIKPCLACEALIPASALFCPDCGDFTLSVTGVEGTIPPIGSREGGAAAALSRVVAGLVAASGVTLLLAILLDFLSTQQIGS